MNVSRLAAAVLLAVLLAPAALAQGQAEVTGTVIYLERILLPPTARVIVQLQDVSRADAAATVLAEQVIDVGAGPPYAFALSYDPAQIQDNLTYAVRAEIRDGDQLLFTTAESFQVITRGNPTSDVEIRLVRVGGGDGGGAPATAPPPSALPATGGPATGALALLLLAAAALAAGLGARRAAR